MHLIEMDAKGVRQRKHLVAPCSPSTRTCDDGHAAPRAAASQTH